MSNYVRNVRHRDKIAGLSLPHGPGSAHGWPVGAGLTRARIGDEKG